MADKRISQLIERVDIANDDVLPIVASGATTTNKVTVSTLQDWMQDNLDVGVTSVGITIGSTGTDVNVTGSPVTSSGNITINIPTASATNRGLLSSANWTTFNNKVSSVGLSMPSAFSVANSPITGSGTIAVTGAGTVSQYIRGDGSLADFPSGGGGGGASVNYYLNGSVSQGTIGGIAYQEMNKTPVLGAGTDFVAIADGYLASFITDAGDPGLLEIPGGNWNFETYFSASSGGGTPTFYVELYKVNSGGTATLIASNSGTPELIAFGTTITPYFSTLAVPTTALAITDRLALRYYVARSGRTITLHTENSHLCQIITTFTTGLTALNGLTAQVQNFATGTSGTDFGISSSVSTHTFNLPTASASNRGALSSADWTTFNNKQPALNGTGFVKISGTSISYDNSTYLTTSSASSTYLPLVGGTLTGNLNGTTASFENGVNLARTSGNVGIGIDAGSEKLEVFSGSSRLVQKFRTSTNGLTTTYASANATVGFIGNGLGLFSTATETQFGIRSESDLLLGAGGGVRLTIAAAGGATFSGNVTAASGLINGTTDAFFDLNRNASGSAGRVRFQTAGTDEFEIGLKGGVAGFHITKGDATELVTVSTGGNVGIGTITPTDFGSTYKVLSIDGAGGGGVLDLMNTGVRTLTLAVDGGEASISSRVSGNPLIFKTNNAGTVATRLTIASTGAATFSSSVTSKGLLVQGNYSAVNGIPDTGVWALDASSSDGFGTLVLTSRADTARPILFSTSNGSVPTERMRITSGGDVLVGATSIPGAGSSTTGVSLISSGAITAQRAAATVGYFGRSNDGELFAFYRDTTQVGNISVTSVLTTYNTTSDYRLKEDLQEFNGLEKVQAIKVYDYKWKLQESRMNGVLAHELADVLPYAVQGEKDEVNEDGTDKMQSVDYSKIVPILIKAIQELKAEIDSLKNQMK